MLMSWPETTEHSNIWPQGFRNDLSFLSRPQNFFLLLWSSWYRLQMTISLKWKKYGVWMQEFILCFRYLLFSIGRSNYRYHTAEKAHFLSSSSSSSSARMAPKSPNPRLKSNPRICYPLIKLQLRCVLRGQRHVRIGYRSPFSRKRYVSLEWRVGCMMTVDT